MRNQSREFDEIRELGYFLANCAAKVSKDHVPVEEKRAKLFKDKKENRK